MKKFFALYLLLLLLLLSSCKSQEGYTFAQSFENIESIDIIYVSPYSAPPRKGFLEFEPVATVESEQWDVFFESFYNIPCSAYFLDPHHDLSGNVIRIIYLDGTHEVISAHTGVHIDTNNRWWYPMYYFDIEAFGNLIDSYIN